MNKQNEKKWVMEYALMLGIAVAIAVICIVCSGSYKFEGDIAAEEYETTLRSDVFDRDIFLDGIHERVVVIFEKIIFSIITVVFSVMFFTFIDFRKRFLRKKGDGDRTE